MTLRFRGQLAHAAKISSSWSRLKHAQFRHHELVMCVVDCQGRAQFLHHELVMCVEDCQGRVLEILDSDPFAVALVLICILRIPSTSVLPASDF